tara:strand:- start:466 stop:786 length:321 start_codon:yes stop_codon:yes gene_type:complete
MRVLLYLSREKIIGLFIMVNVKRIVLDVLKPHQPNALDFARTIAETGVDYRVKLIVLEIDENTETVQIQLFGSEIDFNTIQSAITNMGGSLHSIDEVEVHNETVAG